MNRAESLHFLVVPAQNCLDSPVESSSVFGFPFFLMGLRPLEHGASELAGPWCRPPVAMRTPPTWRDLLQETTSATVSSRVESFHPSYKCTEDVHSRRVYGCGCQNQWDPILG